MYRFMLSKVNIALSLSFITLAICSFGVQAGDWTKFHGNRFLSGTVRDAIFKGSNSNSLAVQWQANTGAPIWSSPIAQYHPKVNKTFVYIANGNGLLSAYDAATGERIWYYKSGAAISSTPLLWGSNIWFGSQDRYLRKLDAITGEIKCSYISDGGIVSSPLAIDPDGIGPTGAMIYFGDAGLAGADDGGHVAAVDVNTCNEVWRFTGYGVPPGSATLSGTWSPISFAPDWSGSRPPLILFGGSSPDNGVYAINAITGNADTNIPHWRLQAAPHINDLDVGAGITVGHVTKATPGGVGFVSAKNSVMRAINLNTGAQIWEFDTKLDSPGKYAIRSTAAYAQGAIFYGYGNGLYALNATTGSKLWKTEDFGLKTLDVLSSPAISFPSDLGKNLGDSAIFFGDVGGTFRVVNGKGEQVWSYDTGGTILSSPAIIQDQVFVGSSNGFLYAFSIGGGVSEKPNTVITTPADGATVENPGAGIDLTIKGTATDDISVSRVLVAIKNFTTSKWWDGATNNWVSIFTQTEAIKEEVGGVTNSVNWQFKFPSAIEGGKIFVQAEAVDSDGQHDGEVAIINFTIPTLGNPPTGVFTYPEAGKNYISYFPDGRNSYPIKVTGSAQDALGVKQVWVSVRNFDHNEYYCGPAGCSGLPAGTLWRPSFAQVQAVLDNPGGTFTTWSVEFPTYDHPHNYRFQIRPYNLNGEKSQVWIDGGKICVRDPGPVSDCYEIK